MSSKIWLGAYIFSSSHCGYSSAVLQEGGGGARAVWKCHFHGSSYSDRKIYSTRNVGMCITYAFCSSLPLSCWMDESKYNYFLSIPVVVSIFLNFIFLVNIVRVLVTKLRAANASPDQCATRKVGLRCCAWYVTLPWNYSICRAS